MAKATITSQPAGHAPCFASSSVGLAARAIHAPPSRARYSPHLALFASDGCHSINPILPSPPPALPGPKHDHYLLPTTGHIVTHRHTHTHHVVVVSTSSCTHLLLHHPSSPTPTLFHPLLLLPSPPTLVRLVPIHLPSSPPPAQLALLPRSASLSRRIISFCIPSMVVRHPHHYNTLHILTPCSVFSPPISTYCHRSSSTASTPPQHVCCFHLCACRQAKPPFPRLVAQGRQGFRFVFGRVVKTSSARCRPLLWP